MRPNPLMPIRVAMMPPSLYVCLRCAAGRRPCGRERYMRVGQSLPLSPLATGSASARLYDCAGYWRWRLYWRQRATAAATGETAMTIQARYSIDDFVGDMTGLLAGQPDQRVLFDRGSAFLERLVRDPQALPEQFRRPSGTGRRANHGSYALYRGPGLFVSAVVWGPGDGVGPHDHHTWGMIGVLGNAIEETRYRRVDEREREG